MKCKVLGSVTELIINQRVSEACEYSGERVATYAKKTSLV